MGQSLGSYLLVLVLGLGLTLVVGQVLLRTGQDYLAEVFSNTRTARSVNRLLGLLFHLVVLGILAIISTIDVPVDGELQTVVTKLGVILLVLGAAHGATMLVLARIRARRHEQDLADEMTAQIEFSRQQQQNQSGAQYGQHVGSPRAHTPQSRPVIESGPQQ